MRSKLSWLCALVLFSGCVSASKHEDLKKKYDAARAQLEESHARVKSLEQAIVEREYQAADLTARIEEGREQVARLESEQERNAKLIASYADESERLAGELAELLKDRSRLKESTEKLKQALAELSLRKIQTEQRIAEYRALLARFKNLIDAGSLRVRIVDGRMVLALPTDVLFDSGSAKLSKAGKETVQQLGGVLAGLADRRFQVEGHTDDVPIRNAPFASNWELAAARALVVVRTLTSSGVRSEALSAASYGEFHPSVSNASEQGRAENRRIEIILPPDLSTVPGYEELQQAIAQQP
jgi:chemotaxis protein MotB